MNFVFKFTYTKRTIFLTNDLPHNKYCLSWLWDNNTNVVFRPCTTLLDGRDWFHTTLRQAVFMINGLSMKPIIFVITWKKRCHLRLLSHLTEPCSHCRDRMRIVGFTTTCAISACHQLIKLWIRTPFMARCTRYNIMLKSLSVTWESGFLRFPPPIKLTATT
jgi:hypothetical protein